MRDTVSPNQQEVIAVKTYCDKPSLSFAFPRGVDVDGRVERDVATGVARLKILVDSWLFTRNSSESIESDRDLNARTSVTKEGRIKQGRLCFLHRRCSSKD